MKMKIKSPDTPVAIFKVDRTKLIPCYIPEFEGHMFSVHALVSLIKNNVDFYTDSIYDTQQMAQELWMYRDEEEDTHRYNAEFAVSQLSSAASQAGLFYYEYLGDTADDYGHYVRYSFSPINKKGN